MTAFRRLFDRHYRPLVRFLYVRTGDPELAADLAQEAFVRLLTHRPRRPRPWLYAVAANLARDAAATAGRRTRHLRLLEAETRDAAEPGPEESLERRRREARVLGALADLPERDRTLLLLREEGLSYREMAAMVGVARTSIGPLLTRAERRFLRRYEAEREAVESVRAPA